MPSFTHLKFIIDRLSIIVLVLTLVPHQEVRKQALPILGLSMEIPVLSMGAAELGFRKRLDMG